MLPAREGSGFCTLLGTGARIGTPAQAWLLYPSSHAFWGAYCGQKVSGAGRKEWAMAPEWRGGQGVPVLVLPVLPSVTSVTCNTPGNTSLVIC